MANEYVSVYLNSPFFIFFLVFFTSGQRAEEEKPVIYGLFAVYGIFFLSFFLGLYAKEEKFRRIEKKDTGIFNKTKRKYNLSWLVIFVVALLNFESTFPFGYFLSFFRTPTFLRL